jgi:phosphoglycerol transferase
LVFLGVASQLGCTERFDPKAKITSESQPATAAAMADRLGPRYEASLEQGIDFRRPGFPLFLDDVTGLSVNEAWGRWSEGKHVVFKFKQPLPQKFDLILRAGAFGPNIGKPCLIDIGSEQRRITFSSDPFTQPETYRIAFRFDGRPDSIQITIPEPSRLASDARMLGIGFISMRIEAASR